MEMLDEESVEDFVNECKELGAQLHGCVKSLQDNIDDQEQFKEFGNLVDRIYGTAATFGFKDFADYCLALKQACLKVSQIDNPRAKVKTRDLMENFVTHLVSLLKSVRDEEELKRLQHIL